MINCELKYELILKNAFNIRFFYPIRITKRNIKNIDGENIEGPIELTYMVHKEDILEFTGDARFEIEGSEYYVGRVDRHGSTLYEVKLLQVS